MASSSFQRLIRVLELEEKQAWRNRAVIGGMQSMAKRWRVDAEAETADQQIVDVVVRLMDDFEASDPTSRPSIADSIRLALDGDLGVLRANESADQSQSGRPVQAESEVAEGGFVEVDIPPPEPTHIAQKRARSAKSDPPRKAQDLQSSPGILKGVGSTTVKQLARLGIHQVVDLLWHLPSRYDDFSQLRTIAQLEPGENVTVVANLWEIRERKISMNRQMIQGILADATGTLHATWWNKWVKQQLTPGNQMRFSGKVGLYMGQKTLESPVFEDVDEEMVGTGRLSPVYRLTEGLSNKRLRNMVKGVLDSYAPLLSDPLPPTVLEKFGLADLSAALAQVHFPDSHEQLQAAQRRLAFEEFFYIQLGVLNRRQAIRQASAQAFSCDDELMAWFEEILPFTLTAAQDRVMDEVRRDLQRTVPMIRLVQGDVGSGKTAIAAGAMFVAAANGAQSALLAPTQILAEQHFAGIGSLLKEIEKPAGGPLRLALLTGRVTGSERADIVEGLRSGLFDIVVGTTALIQETVEFDNLGFVVVDEQHRFGVEQRGALRSKGEQPHLLVMSATPIPRSLALTVYGDLDVSVIDELPPGRIPVQTKWFEPRERERLYNFLHRQVDAGRQGYIIYPLVEESEKLVAGAATAEYERLQKEVFPDLRLALMHGRLSGQEKDEVMSAFAAGDYDVLVSTSVVEVGIDVANASMIMIEDAERFGLAQLHQMRGRVGRGAHKSYCALVSNADSNDARERLVALQESNSGFVLAEKDLELRGPGDFLGTRQSGLPDLRAAHLSDVVTLAEARQAAQDLYAQDSDLGAYPELVKQVDSFWRGHGEVN